MHTVKNSNFIGNHYVPPLSKSLDVWRGIVKTNLENGDCGSLLILQTYFGPVIGGIHFVSALDSHLACANVIPKKAIFDIISDLSTASSSTVNISAPSVKVGLTDLHNKSEFKWISQGAAKVYGSLTVPRAGGKSLVCDTPMNEYLTKYGYEKKYKDYYN